MMLLFHVGIKLVHIHHGEALAGVDGGIRARHARPAKLADAGGRIARAGIHHRAHAKAIAIARGFLIPSGLDVTCVPTFQDIEISGESRTAIRLSVRAHTLDASAIDQTVCLGVADAS